MGYPVAVRGDYPSSKLRALAKRCRNAGQARRLLSIAAVIDGSSRTEAAKIGGMDRQTLRDWVHRFNEDGPDGLINHPAPGAAPKLTKAQKARLAALVEQGPIPAIHDVVRWRACDLMQWIYEEFGVSVSDSTVYRMLDDLGFSHVSARPKAYEQNEEASGAFKKTSPTKWRRSATNSPPKHRLKSGSRMR
jgi:transposase